MSNRTHFRTCNLCEAMCGIAIELDDNGRILSIKGDADDPFSQGHICPKAVALQDVYHDPDRLKRPLRRTATGWEEIGWEEAYDEVVANLRRVQAAHGRDAVGVYLGNPNVHNMGSILYAPNFIRALGTRNRFSATSVDQLPHHYAAFFMFGHQLLLPVPDVDRTDFFLMLGANPLVSNGSLMTAGGIERRLKALQARGGRLVVVDPRRTETAVLADTHLAIRPGSDAALLLALIHTVVAEDMVKPGRLADVTDGLGDLPALVAPFTPERVAATTGIPAATIRQLARDFATAERAVCYGRIGTSTQAFGGTTTWLINVLNLITGNLDEPGGAMFTLPAFDAVGMTTAFGAIGRYGRWQSRVRGLPEFGGELPVAALAEEILTPGDGQIRAMVTVAGNPVLSTPNGRQLDAAFARLEYMVAIDIYLNETTRHAHIILPPTTGLETDHYEVVFHVLAVRNTAKYSPALFPPGPDARHDWEILRDLRVRLEATGGKLRRGKGDVFHRLAPARVVDLGLRYGPYGGWGRNLGKQALSLRKLKRAPHGVDLGPLRPVLLQRLPASRIKLMPHLFVADLARVERELLNGRGPADALQLIGRRQLRSNNSWMHNSERLVRGKDRCTLLMHPSDAAVRGLTDGQPVVVASRVGRVALPLELDEGMRPGVVSMPHGWGHGRDGTQLAVANAHPGVSINDLTDELAIDPVTGNAAFCGIAVAVEPAP